MNVKNIMWFVAEALPVYIRINQHWISAYSCLSVLHKLQVFKT